MQKKGRFTSEWIAQLKQAVSLVDIASENIELRKTGNRFMGRCPFHGDRTPSFSVNKDFYYCFGCKETGDVISFVTKLQGLSFEEACEDLAEKANVKIPEGAYQADSEEEKALYQRRQKIQKAARLNHFASLQYYHKNLQKKAQNQPLFQEARDYLKERGISEHTIEKFQVGVAGAQPDGLVQFLTAAKAPLEIAREFGLIRKSQKQAGDYDFFRERLLFPLIDMRGRVCGFGGRIMPSVDERLSRSGDMKLPKYLNSSENELFYKSKFLYGLFQAKRAIREEECVIIVEGYFDVVALHQHGIENAVATCGTSLTDDHLKTLSRLAKRMIVFFDQDAAGIGATVKAMELGLKNGVLLYGIPYGSKKDPDEFLLENPAENLALLKKWISDAHPLLDYMVEQELRLSEGKIEERSQAIKKITKWLQDFADPVGRSLRAQDLITRWKIPPQALGPIGGGAQAPTRPVGGGAQTPTRPIGGAPAPSRPIGGAAQTPTRAPSRRRPPIKPGDRSLLQFLVKFNEYGEMFLQARKQLPKNVTLAALFEDPEIRTWVQGMADDPAGFTRLKVAPETTIQSPISQELQSLILEGLLQETVAGNENQLQGLLNRGIHRSWAQFSQQIKADMAKADSQQDMEKFRELSEQFLDLQRKLKEFEDSYVTGKASNSGEFDEPNE